MTSELYDGNCLDSEREYDALVGAFSDNLDDKEVKKSNSMVNLESPPEIAVGVWWTHAKPSQSFSKVHWASCNSLVQVDRYQNEGSIALTQYKIKPDNALMKISSYSPRTCGVFVLSLILFLLGRPAGAAIWYVDSAATGLNNGTSWANAWKTLAFSGLSAGDTVYISGGPKGGTRTYNLAGEFTSISGFINGTPGNPVTYQIGQDASHNGTAIFNHTVYGSHWIFGGHDWIISGDAGDGKMHFKVINYLVGWDINSVSNIRISYIDLSTIANMGACNPGTGVEIDHCYAYINDLAADHAFYASFTGSAYNVNLFHHNTIYVPYTNGGIGADALQINGNAYSIYNNCIYGYGAAYTGGQHQDGQQSTGPGSYIKIYSNLFVDIQNYPIYVEPAFGGYAHVSVYNNVMVNTSGAGSQAIAAGGWMSPLRTLDDCVIANNLADGFSLPFTCRDPAHATSSGVFSNCYFYNNISVNGGANIIDPGVVSANNVSVTAAQGPSYFAKYIAGSASNDYHLQSPATALIGTGTNLYVYFNTDMEGNSRVSSGAWDLGPHINIGSTSTPSKPSNLRLSSP